MNRNGLVNTYRATSQDLKAFLLTAHQDVVPASSISKWTYPPFESHHDGQYRWGPGSSDCKNNLIGILSVVESLLSQDWKPRRSVVLAFGFDEETGGVRGASKRELGAVMALLRSSMKEAWVARPWATMSTLAWVLRRKGTWTPCLCSRPPVVTAHDRPPTAELES